MSNGCAAPHKKYRKHHPIKPVPSKIEDHERQVILKVLKTDHGADEILH